jgi:hypothetical protein
LELVLKGFLLVYGIPMEDLKKRGLGHDLERILRKANAPGLARVVSFSALWEDEIRKANGYYGNKGFEYFHVVAAVRGYPDLPVLDVLNEIAIALLKGLEEICLAA